MKSSYFSHQIAEGMIHTSDCVIAGICMFGKAANVCDGWLDTCDANPKVQEILQSDSSMFTEAMFEAAALRQQARLQVNENGMAQDKKDVDDSPCGCLKCEQAETEWQCNLPVDGNTHCSWNDGECVLDQSSSLLSFEQSTRRKACEM